MNVWFWVFWRAFCAETFSGLSAYTVKYVKCVWREVGEGQKIGQVANVVKMLTALVAFSRFESEEVRPLHICPGVAAALTPFTLDGHGIWKIVFVT